jgi:ribosomal protein L11 methyltransferase
LRRRLKPEDELTILELRLAPESIFALEEPSLSSSLAESLGAEAAEALIGLHIEADFAFLFFSKDLDPAPWLASSQNAGLNLRMVHRLRYDQWQDGAGAPPFRLGPLEVLPAAWAESFEADFAKKSLSSQDGRRAPLEGSSPPKLPPLIIDPGLAFGFGGHPTTLACLEFLLRVYHPHLISPEPIPETALDLGTGTGVLALAAARLGAKKVLGVDHSHLAVEAARQNALANSLEGKVEIQRGLAQDYAARPAELLMANIPLFVLKDLINLGSFANRKFVIVSGLLLEEGEVFLSLLWRGRPLAIIDQARSDRWMSFLIDGSSI